MDRYGNLNGLRAYSAIGIALMHYQANIEPKPEMGYLTDVIIPFFTNFVFLFFMISAFAMCCGYYDKVKNKQVDFDSFYKSRYKRILPFFALLCLIDIVVTRDIDSIYQSFMNCTLVFNLLPNPDIHVIGVGWFLGTIFLFYIMFPFFTFLMGTKKRGWVVLLISFVIHQLCVSYFFKEPFIDFDIGRHNILYSAPYFIVGGIVFLYRKRISSFVDRIGWWSCVIVLSYTIARFIVSMYCYSDAVFFYVDMFMYSIWLSYALGKSKMLLQNKIVNYLSGVSMEIYLCHMVMFRAVEKVHIEHYLIDNNMIYILTCVIGIGMAIAFSHVVKYVVFKRLGI